MDQALAPPGEAVARLAGRIGEPVSARLLSDRRGSRVWKVQGPLGAVALKANGPDGDKGVEVGQEDGHLLRLAAAGALAPGYRVNGGAWEGGRWLALRWVEGVALWRALAIARGAEGDRASVRPWLLGVARSWAECLARMHAVGWAHADVQPTNTLVTRDGRAAVIDYALACGPYDGPRLPYRGALTHTTAPEVAAAVLATPADSHVQAQPAADVWGLGASLFWCWTGHRPVEYEDDVDRMDKLRVIAKGGATAIGDVRPWAFPAFEEAITACLSVDPADRPAAQELAAAW